MRYCNINIQDDTKRFKYFIEYKDNVEYQVLPDLHYSVKTFNDDLRVDFFETSQIARNDNYWQEHVNREVVPPIDRLTDYIPQEHGVPRTNISSVDLYFPTNSVEAFTNNNLYALTINTWIHGHIVYLGTYIIDRRDATACRREKKFLNTRYFECVNVKIIDPWFLIYSDQWKDFRQQVCHEEEGETELNNTGSVLNFTLYPVVWNEDRYIKLDPYIGGQNAINISDTVSDYIGCGIELQDSDEGKLVHSSISFNRDYDSDDDGEQSFDDFKLYMKETYDVEGDLRLDYNLLVVDKENIYKVVTKENVTSLSCDFTEDDIYFSSWDGWKEGLQFIVNIDIYTVNAPSAFVDLGLPSGVLWSTVNVGATNDKQAESWYGDYFAWGETKPKELYNQDTYKFDDNGVITKYNPDVDGLTTLLPEDDAATQNFNASWKIPTRREFEELIENTTVDYVADYQGVSGLEGFTYTSNINGESLFIPAAGQKYNSEVQFVGTPYYWSSSLNTDYESGAASFAMDFGENIDSFMREVGLTVRPVTYDTNATQPLPVKGEGERDNIMLLRSNTIGITQDVMKFFIDNQTVTGLPKYINLDSLDMNNYTVNAVNKIEKTVIQVDKPNDTKANMIKPVYFRVHELSSLVLHPAVTENICINLDAYKSTVETFFIRIENTTFVESARNNAGVIFKIVGTSLAGEVAEGTFYILNQDKELVTTGKFTYES